MSALVGAASSKRPCLRPTAAKAAARNAGSTPPRRSACPLGSPVCVMPSFTLPGPCCPASASSAHRLGTAVRTDACLSAIHQQEIRSWLSRSLRARYCRRRGAAAEKGQRILSAGGGSHGGDMRQGVILMDGQCPLDVRPGAPQRKAAQGSVRQHKLVTAVHPIAAGPNWLPPASHSRPEGTGPHRRPPPATTGRVSLSHVK